MKLACTTLKICSGQNWADERTERYIFQLLGNTGVHFQVRLVTHGFVNLFPVFKDTGYSFRIFSNMKYDIDHIRVYVFTYCDMTVGPRSAVTLADRDRHSFRMCSDKCRRKCRAEQNTHRCLQHVYVSIKIIY